VDEAGFLLGLLRHLRGHVILFWDRGRIHLETAIEAVYEAYPRLHLQVFPAYAPKLIPVEQEWNDPKGHTANSLLWNTRDICRSLQANTRLLRRSQAKLRAFILASKLPSPP
jgi:hypothetical protein